MDNIVTLRASWIDSETKKRRSAAFNTSMNPELITNSRSLNEAIEYFTASGTDLPGNYEFDYFEINKQRYTWDELFLTWNVESSLQTRTSQ